MTGPLFFGYGSLVNRETHAYHDPRPARLSGWRRVWRHTSLRPVAFLSVDPAPGVEIEGLVAAVPGEDWRALDERERAYVRHDVTAAVRHGGPDAPCATYRVQEGLIAGPSEDAPILRSYLDTVLGGFVAEHGAGALERFFETTAGWGPIRDDRAQPVYPRARPATPDLGAEIDRLLKNL